MIPTTYEKRTVDGLFRRTYPCTAPQWAGRWQLDSGHITADNDGKEWRMTNDLFRLALGEKEARAWVDALEEGPTIGRAELRLAEETVRYRVRPPAAFYNVQVRTRQERVPSDEPDE